MTRKAIMMSISLAVLATVSWAADKKAYFPVRVDRNYDDPQAKVKGGSYWRTLTWRGELVNNYDFAPRGKGRAKFLAEVKANRNRLAK
jgi:hypothetical protein